MNQTKLSVAPGAKTCVALGLRRMVKDGLISPGRALAILDEKRRRGEYIKTEIEAWLRRKASVIHA